MFWRFKNQKWAHLDEDIDARCSMLLLQLGRKTLLTFWHHNCQIEYDFLNGFLWFAKYTHIKGENLANFVSNFRTNDAAFQSSWAISWVKLLQWYYSKNNFKMREKHWTYFKFNFNNLLRTYSWRHLKIYL